MKDGHWSGILKNFTYEDFIIEESMGPIADRTQRISRHERRGHRPRPPDAAATRSPPARRASCPSASTTISTTAASARLAIRFPRGTDWREIDPLAPPSFGA